VGQHGDKSNGSNWRSRPHPLGEISRSKVVSITDDIGKSGEGGTVAAGVVLAEMLGNASGAKDPCCTHFSSQHSEAGTK